MDLKFSLRFTIVIVVWWWCLISGTRTKLFRGFCKNTQEGLQALTAQMDDLLLGPACIPDEEYNLSCWDEFNTEIPELSTSSTNEFSQAFFSTEMIDCRPMIVDSTEDSGFVICDNQNWTRIHLDQFPDRLMFLRVNGTSITHLAENSFTGKTIRMLELDDNDLRSIDNEAFAGLEGLLYLKISKSLLTAVEDPNNHFLYPFRHLNSLTHLLLDNNELTLTEIDTSAKSEEVYLKNLTYLSFRGNPLKSLEKSIFYPLRNSSVKMLNLQNCQLNSINQGAFRHLYQIEQIDFFNNPGLFTPNLCKYPLALSFGFLNGETFRRIGMSGNGLILTPKLLLLTIGENLEVLNLSNNFFLDVGSTANTYIYSGFPVLPKLHTLIMQNSLIFFIQDDALASSLTNLRHLDLRGNFLTKFCNGFKLNTIEYLDLSYQHRDNIEIEFEAWDENNFSNMTNLKILKISGIHLTHFRAHSFKGLSNLKELYLDNSLLETLEDGIFQPLNSLQLLDLSFNKNLRRMTSNVFAGLASLKSLNLAYSWGAFIANETRLSNQGLLFNLRNVQFLNLSCALNINCVPIYDYESPLDPNLLKYLDALETLDLSHNGLASWSDDQFIDNVNLTRLYLNDNNLVFLTDGYLESFERLKVLDFRNNPITCNDNVAHFFRLTLDTPDLEVVGWQNGTGYFCHQAKNLTLTMTFKEYYDDYVWDDDDEEEDNSLNTWFSGFFLGSLTMVGISSFVVYNVYQRRFFINYFLLLRRRKLLEKRDPNMDYTYDVFVSYSQEDHKWVTEELLPSLENQEPKLKCCIHERDFKVGVAVTENIVECIDRSRKFAMILSKGFVRSKWCLFETHLAHCRMLDSNENNLVVVLKERVALRDMDRNLQLLVKTWTYLEWKIEKQIEFWDRLRATILRKDSNLFKLPNYRKQI